MSYNDSHLASVPVKMRILLILENTSKKKLQLNFTRNAIFVMKIKSQIFCDYLSLETLFLFYLA